MRLIVSDASPLIVLAASGPLSVLDRMTEEVVVPESVFAECTTRPDKLGAPEILAAREQGLFVLRADLPEAEVDDELAGLDAGERAAILMAQALACPVLIDERLGRHAAHRHGLAVIGSLGLLLEAKRIDAVAAIAPIVEQWRDWGYFLSENLVRAVLERAGEE